MRVLMVEKISSVTDLCWENHCCENAFSSLRYCNVAASSFCNSHAYGSCTSPDGRTQVCGRRGAIGRFNVMHCRIRAGKRYRFVMRVWIDQDLCTGDGLCVDLCPDVFVQLEDGIAYVAESGEPLNDPGGAGSLADVTTRDFSAVVQAADVCPGECIFVEIND